MTNKSRYLFFNSALPHHITCNFINTLDDCSPELNDIVSNIADSMDVSNNNPINVTAATSFDTSHFSGKNNFSAVSQTQDGFDDLSVFEGSDSEGGPIALVKEGLEHDSNAAQMNRVLDDTDDYLSPELKSILDYRSLSSILKFKLEYTHIDTVYPIDLVKNEDTYATVNFIIINELQSVLN